MIGNLKLKITLLIFSLCSVALQLGAQDTIRITSKILDPKVLREGTHRYLVYFKMAKDSVRTQTQFWTRLIKRVDYHGTPAIEITQEWEDKDSVMHIVQSISDATTMRPIYHKTWWKVPVARGADVKVVNITIVDFSSKTVNYNGKLLSDADTTKQAKKIWDGYKSAEGKFFLNWHSDLEIFPILPYRKGVTFLIPFYDPGTSSGYQEVVYKVTGSDVLMGYNDQKIDCWLLVHEEKGNKEIYWISKQTKEVLKLEQVINDRIFRYKIKLGFSL